MSGTGAHHVPAIEARRRTSARRAFRKLLGDVATRRRQDEIDALPSKTWKGRTVHALLCQADFGKGPHTLWVPEGLLWALIHFDAFRCPYHR